MPVRGAGLVRPPLFTPGSPSAAPRGGRGARGLVLLRAPVAVPLVTTLVQDAWPPRVLVTVTGLTTWGATEITLWREVAAARTLVRGAGGVPLIGDDAYLATDAEQPFGIPVRYVAVVTPSNGEPFEAVSAPLTVALPGGKVALSDAINGTSAEVVVSAWPDKARNRASTVYQVGGRNIVVSGSRGGFSSQLEIVTETDSARENLLALLDSLTSGVLQLRQPGGYGGVDAYLAVTADTENRWSQDGTDARRTWTLDVVEVAGWAAAFETRGFTYADLAAAYTGLNYGNLNTDYATYLALAQGTFS